MANMHLVTGYRGENHVTSADQGSFNAAVFGAESYVLNRGNKFVASIITNNSIRILDGDLLIQGRHVRLNENTYVDMTIENGTQTMKRNDLIVARYTKNNDTGVEECNLVVIKGTATSGTPTDPAYNDGDIITEHDSTVDFPLYRVPLDGINAQTLVPLFDIKKDIGSIKPSDIGAAAESVAKTASLAAGGWVNNTQTVSVSGITANDNLIITPAPASHVAWCESMIRCTAQGAGTLTFTCEDVPTVALTANILIVG